MTHTNNPTDKPCSACDHSLYDHFHRNGCNLCNCIDFCPTEQQATLTSEEELREKIREEIQKDPYYMDMLNLTGVQGMHDIESRILHLLHQYGSTRELEAKAECAEFAADVLAQFGYNGSTGGLSVLEEAESIVKGYNELTKAKDTPHEKA